MQKIKLTIKEYEVLAKPEEIQNEIICNRNLEIEKLEKLMQHIREGGAQI